MGFQPSVRIEIWVSIGNRFTQITNAYMRLVGFTLFIELSEI